MVMSADPWWIWLLPFMVGAPWIAASIWLWRQRPRDGSVPLSMAEQARRRLWTS